ncbi:MAG: cytochrome c biogenesis protein CcsA [Paludibacteraceae bacterium]|nr:cytochrome c biogenesis protein CcsA [Paludibacteraceae bacterium]
MRNLSAKRLSSLSRSDLGPFTVLLHIALIIMLVGACVTHFWGVQGEVHIRADKAETVTVRQSIIPSIHHSVSLFLWDFQIVYAGDVETPVDYVSQLRLLDRSRHTEGERMQVDEGEVRMNKPLKYHGWRFCQSDYDSDGLGVVLSYNYDPWGIGITYTGYALLLIAMIGFFFQPRTWFRTLLNKSVFGQRSGLYSVSFAVLIIVLAAVMTKVVTPKPPLQPVLQTPLLGIHVSVIMLAYTLFAVIMINGIIALVHIGVKKINGKMVNDKMVNDKMVNDKMVNDKMVNDKMVNDKMVNDKMVNDKMVNSLMTLSQVLLYPALFCLTAGIFIGAVWANLSWGRYWGWDPKETWALITMFVYAAMLHLPLVLPKMKIKNHEVLYHVLGIVAFLFVLFTYFGVNRLLEGLHSYA